MLVVLALVLFGSTLTSSDANARSKKFIRSHTYEASDDDSKNSSRRKALNELRAALLREIGVYLEAYIEIEAIGGEQDREFIREEIRTTTAGTTETRVLSESWDGRTYFVEAEIMIDEAEVLNQINHALRRRSADEELARLRERLETANNEVRTRTVEATALRSQLAARTSELEARNVELKDLQLEIAEATGELARITARRRAEQEELDRILSQMAALSASARGSFATGLTMGEVQRLVGRGRGSTWCLFPDRSSPLGFSSQKRAVNYGEVWFLFGAGDLLETMTEARAGVDPCRSPRLR